MKSMTFKELDLMVEMAESFEGFQVQDILFSNDVLAIYLRLGPKEAYLVADVGSQKPVFIATQEPLPAMKKETKPLLLFLRAHLDGKRLVSARRVTELGRMVSLRFENRDEWLELELHLFAQGRNIVASTDGAHLSLNKVRDLPPVTNVISDETPRTPAEIYSDWIGFRRAGKSGGAPADPAAQFEKLRGKKELGLKGLHDKLRELSDGSLKAAGDWLNEHRTLEVPLEFDKFIDHKKSLRENVAAIFDRVKANKKKLESVRERLALMERELADLTPASAAKTAPRKAPPSPLEDAKGRTKHFENGVAAYIGKSAADNLKILRKAKAWYWWVHPKDLPGSHAIIAVEKGAALDSHILRQVALWTLEESLTPKQWNDWQGLKCQFIYTECRFVTPIKGDKLGRVNYKNEKTLTLTVTR